MRKHSDYCLILAGGVGRRLWPYSRKGKPKQFLDIFGSGRTLLQQTFDRIAKSIPKENIYVSTFEGYGDLVREQLPEVDAEHVLAEPVQLSTVPAVAWASYHISLKDPEANMVVTPADHCILDGERFARQVDEGLDFVEAHPDFLAMGVRPTVPHTGYGYIQKGEETCGEQFSRVQSFVEKPSYEFAKMFMEGGEFLWNTGLFLWNMRTIRHKLDELVPVVAYHLSNSGADVSRERELELVRKFYSSSLHMSIDLVVLERSRNVYVRECDFGWADVGGWADVYGLERKDADGNVLVGSGKVMFSASRGNLVNLPPGMAAVVDGLEDYLVSLNGNVLVVCRNPADVRRLVSEVQMQFGEDYV